MGFSIAKIARPHGTVTAMLLGIFGRSSVNTGMDDQDQHICSGAQRRLVTAPQVLLTPSEKNFATKLCFAVISLDVSRAIEHF
jgi:hypothetical protein